MTVLVVTCDRDRYQFRLQCLTAGKFLSPTNLHIVINEPDPSTWLVWYLQECSKLLPSHTVHLYTHKDFNVSESILLKNSGWKTQQLFKLLFALKTHTPYVVLDSKNWFIKPTTESDFVKRTRRIKPDAIDMMADALQLFDLQEVLPTRPEITPYIVDPVVVKGLLSKFDSIESFCKWFVQYNQPHEFVLYDLYAQAAGYETDTGYERIPYKNFWHDEKDLTLNTIKQFLINQQHHVLTIHPTALRQLDLEQLENLINESLF
jgi:hypothetical protein